MSYVQKRYVALPSFHSLMRVNILYRTVNIAYVSKVRITGSVLKLKLTGKVLQAFAFLRSTQALFFPRRKRPMGLIVYAGEDSHIIQPPFSVSLFGFYAVSWGFAFSEWRGVDT